MDVTTIKITDDDWLAFKQVMSEYKKGKAPECGSFRALVQAIGRGNNELLRLWRARIAEINQALLQ